MHNWSDEDCVRILKRPKEAISTREPRGKVIIIDVVVGSQSKKQTLEEAQLLLDLSMMTLTNWRRTGRGEMEQNFPGCRIYQIQD
jgi:trans-resveratrol di-O-methyltransferase